MFLPRLPMLIVRLYFLVSVLLLLFGTLGVSLAHHIVGTSNYTEEILFRLSLLVPSCIFALLGICDALIKIGNFLLMNESPAALLRKSEVDGDLCEAVSKPAES